MLIYFEDIVIHCLMKTKVADFESLVLELNIHWYHLGNLFLVQGLKLCSQRLSRKA